MVFSLSEHVIETYGLVEHLDLSATLINSDTSS